MAKFPVGEVTDTASSGNLLAFDVIGSKVHKTNRQLAAVDIVSNGNEFEAKILSPNFLHALLK